MNELIKLYFETMMKDGFNIEDAKLNLLDIIEEEYEDILSGGAEE